jgi:hypothetical protein
MAMARPSESLRGMLDPDFLALGLGGTSMMAMLWTVAMGRRAVGVEMRGDPFLGVHWNLRVDLYHQLGLIDEMMFDRFGSDGIPRRGDGRLFRLAECFYSLDTVAGDIIADEIIDGFDSQQHIVGTIHHVEFIDDRWRDGLPNRVVTLLQPPAPPERPDPRSIRTDIVEVLDGPSTFQAGAASVLVLLRRYLERIEQIDLRRGIEPRARLFCRHRVITAPGEGFVDQPDGRQGVRIEALQELDYRGKFVRVRAPGSEVIDIGVPELFMIAQGFHSSDAERLGFRQHDVAVDHHDGRGPVVAQADFLAGLIEALVGGRLRRRIVSEYDQQGREYWVRQIAVGHEDDPEVGWVLVQVPDFKNFDPIDAGLVPEGTPTETPEFFAAYQHLLYEYYMEQASEILEIPIDELKRVEMVYGPKLFSLVERAGDDARIAVNGVVAGDSFGNGHFLTSGGAITGMVGHGARVLRYWEARDKGVEPDDAIVALAEGIKEDTDAWLQVSAKEYSQAVPINFGAERIAQISAAGGVRASAPAPVASVDEVRRRRHSLVPLDPSDWRRLFLRNGAVRSAPLPELHAMHPALRSQRSARRGARVNVAYVAPRFGPETVGLLQAVLAQPGARVWLISEDRVAGLPENVWHRLAGHWRVTNARDAGQVEDAVGRFGDAEGLPDVLLGTQPDLVVPLGQVRDALGIQGMGAEEARAFVDKSRMRDLLVAAGVPVALDGLGARQASPDGLLTAQASPDDAQGGTLEVISVGGVPAWCSATRATGGGAITLPKEESDPADGAVRRMGLAALRALGMPSGLSHLTWVRRPDGQAAISDVIPLPPAPPIMSLMSLAHGADMRRAWANAVTHGLFAPIPRISAAGVALAPFEGTGDRVVAVPGWDSLSRDLGDLVVEAALPVVGQPTPNAEGHILVRGDTTASVDAALQRITEEVRIQLG